MLSDISVMIASSHAADGVVEYDMQLASELENKAFLCFFGRHSSTSCKNMTKFGSPQAVWQPF